MDKSRDLRTATVESKVRQNTGEWLRGAQGVHREYWCCDCCGRGMAMAQPVSSSTLRNASPGLLAAPLSCRVISSMKSCRAVGKE